MDEQVSLWWDMDRVYAQEWNICMLRNLYTNTHNGYQFIFPPAVNKCSFSTASLTFIVRFLDDSYYAWGEVVYQSSYNLHFPED